MEWQIIVSQRLASRNRCQKRQSSHLHEKTFTVFFGLIETKSQVRQLLSSKMSGEEQRLGIHGPHDHHHLMNTPRMCCFPQRQCFWLKLVFRGSAYFNKVVLRHYTVFNRYLAWFFGRPCKHILGHHTPPHQLRCEIIESNL